MARAPTPPALAELREPTSIESQTTALKQLKNEIVGHDQRKELAIRRGVVGSLVRILTATTKASGKRRSRELNGNAAASRGETAWTGEDEVRLQATLVAGSLAFGGPAFVAPLLAGGILQPLLQALSPAETPPKLVTATLGVLVTIANAVKLLYTGHYVSDAPAAILHQQLYTKPVVRCLGDILAQRSPAAHQHVTLTARLIAGTCSEEANRVLLVKEGILDLLVSRLAAFAASTGHISPFADSAAVAALPPAPPKASLHYLLEAIVMIITSSSYRAARLLYSPAIVGLFPPRSQLSQDSHVSFADYNTAQSSSMQANPIDNLLPQLQAVKSKSEHSFSKAFPALGSFNVAGDIAAITSFADTHVEPSARLITSDDFESPLFAWLIHLARTEHGADRLFAAWLVALLHAATIRFTPDTPDGYNENRDRALKLLLVPLVVSMMDDASSSDQKKAASPSRPEHALEQQTTQMIKERAPAVLAALLGESLESQGAAAGAGAIKKICHVLKRSFDPVVPSKQQMWSPNPQSPSLEDSENDPSRTLGGPGLMPEVVHALKCRESALLAMAAIAHRDDGLRKKIIESGALQCVTDSLTPYDDSTDLATVTTSAKDGNPLNVVIAACDAARSMSRSISVLRTSLIDYGVAKPIFKLLTHPVEEIQVAAIDAIINLVLEFSGVKEDLIQEGIVKTLCDHAHSAHPRKRYLSLWAVKHLVHKVPNEAKIYCVEGLGPGWLLKVASGEPKDSYAAQRGQSQGTTPIGMGTPNAAGERVDLLNAVDEPAMDIDAGSLSSSSSDEETMLDSASSLRFSRSKPHALPAATRARLAAIRDAEQNPHLRAYRDELWAQEQALDILRNLLNDPSQSGMEMVDYVFNTFGTDNLFRVLLAKLKAPHIATSPPHLTSSPSNSGGGNTNSSSKRPASTPLAPSSAQTTSILQSAVFILVHIAACTPKYRTLLLSQTSLFTDGILPLLSHPDPRIRVGCVWLVHNLTWVDDESEKGAARLRALELRSLGFWEKLQGLLKDGELDVKERAKTAVKRMGECLEGVGGGNGGPRSGGLAAGAGLRGWEQ
ncbi:hypothetical protein H2201_004445 [Coniosporium apollinis]|uniref:Armadillo repeat-containing protein 8 n=1 Tax=Coniosporium apollinis TaxID=61459 RepID=A0ABQ9NTY8_9PEZI|nr:hypothetical protein H2201_004445 [Coniosporium apollinis]